MPAGRRAKWGQTRGWTNNSSSFGPYTNTFNGSGTISSQQPYLLDPNGNRSVIIVVTSSINERFFVLDGGAYKPTFFMQETLGYDAGSHTFVFADTRGSRSLAPE